MLTLLIYYLYIPNKLVERNIKSEHTLFLSISHTEFPDTRVMYIWCIFQSISKIPKEAKSRMTSLESSNRYLANNHWPTIVGYKSGKLSKIKQTLKTTIRQNYFEYFSNLPVNAESLFF